MSDDPPVPDFVDTAEFPLDELNRQLRALPPPVVTPTPEDSADTLFGHARQVTLGPQTAPPDEDSVILEGSERTFAERMRPTKSIDRVKLFMASSRDHASPLYRRQGTLAALGLCVLAGIVVFSFPRSGESLSSDVQIRTDDTNPASPTGAGNESDSIDVLGKGKTFDASTPGATRPGATTSAVASGPTGAPSDGGQSPAQQPEGSQTLTEVAAPVEVELSTTIAIAVAEPTEPPISATIATTTLLPTVSTAAPTLATTATTLPTTRLATTTTQRATTSTFTIRISTTTTLTTVRPSSSSTTRLTTTTTRPTTTSRPTTTRRPTTTTTTRPTTTTTASTTSTTTSTSTSSSTSTTASTVVTTSTTEGPIEVTTSQPPVASCTPLTSTTTRLITLLPTTTECPPSKTVPPQVGDDATSLGIKGESTTRSIADGATGDRD